MQTNQLHRDETRNLSLIFRKARSDLRLMRLSFRNFSNFFKKTMRGAADTVIPLILRISPRAPRVYALLRQKHASGSNDTDDE